METLGAFSREAKKPRSRVVQEALRQRRKKELHGKLAEGYLAMADEDRRTAERNLPAFRGVMKSKGDL